MPVGDFSKTRSKGLTITILPTSLRTTYCYPTAHFSCPERACIGLQTMWAGQSRPALSQNLFHGIKSFQLRICTVCNMLSLLDVVQSKFAQTRQCLQRTV